METRNVNLWDLNVPTGMLKHSPKKYKIMGMEAYYKKYKHFYGNIIVDKNYKILDGYVIYCTAKKMRINNVPIKVVNRKDRLRFLLRKVVRKLGIKNN